MPSFRDIKRSARRDLHKIMQVPAYLLATADAEPVSLQVRVFQTFEPADFFQSGTPGLAKMQDAKPSILFMRDDLDRHGLQLRRRQIISVGPGEAYSLDNAMPVDDISVTWFVTRKDAEEASVLPYPGDGNE